MQKLKLSPAIVLLGVMLSAELKAQPSQVTIPPSLILVNYDRISIGQREGLEGGAYVARTDDAAANWYNPAGLARSEKSAVNANGTAYEFTNLSLEGFGQETSGSRLSTIGAFFGGVIGSPVVSSDKLRLGFSVTTPIAWSPSVLDPTFTTQSASGTQVLGYYAELDFSQVIPAVAAGYAPGGPIRLGLSLGVSLTDLRQLQSVSYRNIGSSSMQTSLRSFSTDGSALDFLPAAGVLLDISSNVALGLHIVAPSIRLNGTSRIAYQASQFSGATAQEIFFRDEEARFEYKYPVEIDGGLSVKFSDGEIEADVKYHGSLNDYALYSSDRAAQATITDSNGVPTVTTPAFTSTMNSTRSILNLAIGGHYAITSALRIHAGFLSDLSPVVDGNTSIFRKIDLYGGTIGLSLQGEHLSGSLGLAYSGGTSDPTTITAANGQQAETKLGVKTLHLLYAISYGF